MGYAEDQGRVLFSDVHTTFWAPFTLAGGVGLLAAAGPDVRHTKT
jgi:hypothetical protein